MIATNFNSASWISSRRSKRIRSLPKPANQLCVLSTTHQCLPNRSLLSANAASDASLPQVLSAMFVVVAFVNVQLCRSFTGKLRQTCNCRNRIHARPKHLGIVPIHTADQDHQRNISGIYNDVPLGAKLACSHSFLLTGRRAMRATGITAFWASLREWC